MDIKAFQEKLSALVRLAESQDLSLTQTQIGSCFVSDDLEQEQMLRILTYLKGKGIRIEADAPADEIADKAIDLSIGTLQDLTAEEQEWLTDLLEELQKSVPEEKRVEESFSALLSGSEDALLALTQHYLPTAARLAAENNCAEIPLQDLFQEASLALYTALSELPSQKAGTDDCDAWILGRIRQGLLTAIEEQTLQKQHDDILVGKVEKLDHAVRELSEDEEDQTLPFTLQELAVILDMDPEEIRSTLRLTEGV